MAQKMNPNRIPFTLTQELADGLREVSHRTGIPAAKLVRNGIILVLARYNVHVEDKVQQGGRRPRAEEKKEKPHQEVELTSAGIAERSRD